MVGVIGVDAAFNSEASKHLNVDLYEIVLGSEKLTEACKAKALFCGHGCTALVGQQNVSCLVSLDLLEALSSLEVGHRENNKRAPMISDNAMFYALGKLVIHGDMQGYLKEDYFISLKNILDNHSSVLKYCTDVTGHYLGQFFLEKTVRYLAEIDPSSGSEDVKPYAKNAHAHLQVLRYALHLSNGELPMKSGRNGKVIYLTNDDLYKTRTMLKVAIEALPSTGSRAVKASLNQCYEELDEIQSNLPRNIFIKALKMIFSAFCAFFSFLFSCFVLREGGAGSVIKTYRENTMDPRGHDKDFSLPNHDDIREMSMGQLLDEANSVNISSGKENVYSV